VLPSGGSTTFGSSMAVFRIRLAIVLIFFTIILVLILVLILVFASILIFVLALISHLILRHFFEFLLSLYLQIQFSML
jgi:hypothetical protein